MTTGGTTWPAENTEELNHTQQGGDSKVDQVRKVGKFCKQLTFRPQIQEKIKEFHQGKFTKTQLASLFKNELSHLSDEDKLSMGIGASLDDFLLQTHCFEDQFFYEIEHNLKIRELAKEEMLDSCIETAEQEYDITHEHKKTLRAYLSKENKWVLVNFLEIGKTRRIIIKRALKSELTSKTLDDIDFESLHNKIANLPPWLQSRRIQSVWATMMWGIKVGDNEDIKQAFQRIQTDWTEGDLTADYEIFFGAENTLISQENKKRILGFLVRNYAPTVSFDDLASFDQDVAKKLVRTWSNIATNTHTWDIERQEAILAVRHESALADRRLWLVETRIATRQLDTATQIKVLWNLGSKRRIQQIQNFHNGRPGGITSTDVVDFDESFSVAYEFSPNEVFTDNGLREKLQIKLWNKIKNLDQFVPGSVMMWKSKSHDGKKDTVGYYVIEQTLWDDNENPWDIKLRFLGTNQSSDPQNPLEKWRLSPSGIPRTFTGPQFFDYLAWCSDSGSLDFVDGGADLHSTELQTHLNADGASFYTDAELQTELRQQYGATEIQSEEALNHDLDELLYEGEVKTLESENAADRDIYPGMVFALQNRDAWVLDTFEIEDIIAPSDGEPWMIRIWDGWGTGEDSRRELTFRDFLNHIKQFKSSKYKSVYRMPWGKSGSRFWVEQFNNMMQSEVHNVDGKHKKNSKVMIKDGKIFQYDASGTPQEKTMIKVTGWDKKDLHILSIDGDTAEVSQGTFKQTIWDDKAGEYKQKPEFTGTRPFRIPLTLLWSYFQTNDYSLEKEDTETKYKKIDEKKTSMGWMNILMHSHSLGVLLHGDLWKAPFKAWEEQHHKDHAFHGKITAALAIEKLQNGGLVSGMLNWAEWPSLMVADGNSSFQSYLDELVNKVDAMGSYHRTRLIKQWASNEHFPSAKFMAAMFASMQIFGQLYPYEFNEKDPRHGAWFWYGQICHSIDPNHSKYPHMPPHDGSPWPEKLLNKSWEPMSEIEACQTLFQEFSHPMLKNLGRRFQKYMNGGHKNLVDGGKGNMEQRNSMDERLKWMMDAVVNQKPTEAFGAATDIWLDEGYPTAISTMPYAAMIFGRRGEEMLPATQTHARELFQSGNHIPMLVFLQNRQLWNIFRETGVALAYTISEKAGRDLEDILALSKHHRLAGKTAEAFKGKFDTFWRDHWKEMMHKFTGMRDPMLNLMMNAPDTFDEMLDSLPPEKQEMYRRLRDKKGSIQAYYERMKVTYDSPKHAEMPRNKPFYNGDHFRCRDSFDVGYPMAWVNWDAYWDANMDDKYASGGGATSWDGIFNEIRWFLYKIPKMAEEMTKHMGFTGAKQKEFIHKISRKLYDKNIAPMQRLATQKINAKNPDAEYCSMTAMMFDMIPIQEMFVGGAPAEAQVRHKDYFNKMKIMKAKADELQKTNCPEAIKYREEMATRMSMIVKEQIDTSWMTLAQVENGDFWKSKKVSNPVEAVTGQTLEDFESVVRPQGSSIRHTTQNESLKNPHKSSGIVDTDTVE